MFASALDWLQPPMPCLQPRCVVLSALHGLLCCVLCSLMLGACATRPVADTPATPHSGAYSDAKAPLGISPWALSSGVSSIPTIASADEGGARPTTRHAQALLPGSAPAWHHHKLPGKQVNRFTPLLVDGRDAMFVQSDNSASLLRKRLRIAAPQLGHVKFSWKVPTLIAKANMSSRDTDDSPVRIVLAFEGDRGRFSNKNALMSELSHTLTGEPLPFATLMYVWCNTQPPGSVIFNPRTDRIRKIVVESGAKNLNQWLDYERNIRADFVKTFGEPPGALVGIAIMTDTDNTHSTASAWYGRIEIGNP